MTRVCSACPAPIGALNKSGKCRSCSAKVRYADPAYRERWLAGVRAAGNSDEMRRKRSENGLKRYADPAARAATSEACKQAYATDTSKREALQARAADVLKAWHAKTDRDWSEWHQARAVRQSERALAWCPAERRDEYRALAKKKGIGPKEAKRLMLEQFDHEERRRLAAMSPFERQMELVRKGAKLVEVKPLRRADHAYTLGGVSSGSL